MCKTCEKHAESLRTYRAYEHNFYPGTAESRIKAVRKPQVIRHISHILSQALPTAFFRKSYLLISQLSTPSTGLINTITNR